VIFGPILAKLEVYSAEEAIYRGLVVEGLRNIARGESGRNVQDQMVASLPPKVAAKMLAA
jgi:chemotaxis protein MotA